jgi:hypothetical protein
MDASKRQRLIDGLFKAVWLQGRHISDLDVVA